MLRPVERHLLFLFALRARLCAALGVFAIAGGTAFAEAPRPALNTVFPAGAAVGQTVDVTIAGANLNGLSALYCNAPGVRCALSEPLRFKITIPAETPPGLYDLWAVCENGLSSPRTFSIGNRVEQLEAEPNESPRGAQPVPMNVVINGRIEKGDDLDCFRFEAKQGERVVVECWAERIDSRLRAVLEIFDAEGRRLAVNRGYFGIDPLVDIRVPADGAYIVKVQDLISSGGVEHYYRLDIDTGPRVAFSVPRVVQRGKATRVTLYGWNLSGPKDGGRGAGPSSVAGQIPVLPSERDEPRFDHVDVDIPETLANSVWPMPVRLQPAQAVLEGFAYQLPGSHAPVVIGVTDAPVVLDRSDNHSPTSAQVIGVPGEVSGQLAAADECDWFAIDAKRGEVLYIEALGQRIDSPVDLDVTVLDAVGQQELIHFRDEITNIGGKRFPASHLDPSGRWVVPADGRYLMAVRDLIGGLHVDPRRTYRLSIRREEPELQLVVVPHRDDTAGLNIPRGGREILDVLAFRSRGLTGPIRVAARDLPEGIECPDVWLGPGVDRGTIVLTADRTARAPVTNLKLEGSAETAGLRMARGGTVVRPGMPNGWGRLTSQIPLVASGDALLRISADGHETLDHHLYGKLRVRHCPGSVLDVAVSVERRDSDHQAAVKLTGVGLPDQIRNQTAVIPAGDPKGNLSFQLPPTLPVGRYTIVVRAETTVPLPEKKTETVTAYSNPVTFDVEPAAFLVEVDPNAPTRAKRGGVIQVSYSVERRNGFIGKIHTELAAPGRITDVVGLRGRGETFVGQADKGTLQIVVNEDAPLGRQSFLRLFSVGVVEDEAIFHGSSFLSLDIVE